jgi:protein-disulfide isomerase
VDSPVAKDAVERQRAEGTAIGINQTPTFFLNGKMIVNPQGYEALKAAVTAAAK